MADSNGLRQQHDDHHHRHQQHHHQHGKAEAAKRRTVLIAMDGSGHSFYAFDSVMASDPTVMSRLLEKEEKEVNVIVEKIKGKLTNTGVRGKLIRLTGEPGSAIVESANHHQADFIVTGSRGLGAIRRTLVGSVSDYILHHAKCPVLVCRSKDIKS